MEDEWSVQFLATAVESLMKLSKGDQAQVTKQAKKLKRAPEQQGDALRHQRLDLSGCRRLRVGRLRIVFQPMRPTRTVEILAVGARENEKVYEVAAAELGVRRLRRIS